MNYTVNVEGENWRDILFAASNTKRIRSVEISAALLEHREELQELLNRYGMNVVHVRDLLPLDLGRYLMEVAEPLRKGIVNGCIETLFQCIDMGVQCVTCELGLDRIQVSRLEEEIQGRVHLLRRLAAAVDRKKINICIPVRHPRAYPTSKDWEYAGNIIHEVMHPQCRLTFNLFPTEFSPDFELKKFIRSIYLNAGILRFIYEPSMGERPEDWFSENWNGYLSEYGFAGPLVFRPAITDEEGAKAAFTAVDQLIDTCINKQNA